MFSVTKSVYVHLVIVTLAMTVDEEAALENARRLEIGPEGGDDEPESPEIDNSAETGDYNNKQSDPSSTSSGVQAIKFGIKKNEPPPANVAPVNVLEQCKH